MVELVSCEDDGIVFLYLRPSWPWTCTSRMSIWLHRGYTRGLGYENRPTIFVRNVWRLSKLLGALIVDQAHVSVFDAELALDMYISYVHLVAA